MPNADTHDRITYVFAPVTAVGAQWYWQRPLLAVLATAFMLFAGLMFGPDLDLHSRPYLRWGVLRFIWKPYQAVLKHRSAYSHGPLLGTVIRVVYFLAIMLVLGSIALYFRDRYLYGSQLYWGEQYDLLRRDVVMFWERTEKPYFYSAFAGMWFGALTHTAADVIWSSWKKLKRAI
jgi:uncharacterized metal-binding protein